MTDYWLQSIKSQKLFYKMQHPTKDLISPSPSSTTQANTPTKTRTNLWLVKTQHIHKLTCLQRLFSLCPIWLPSCLISSILFISFFWPQKISSTSDYPWQNPLMTNRICANLITVDSCDRMSFQRMCTKFSMRQSFRDTDG